MCLFGGLKRDAGHAIVIEPCVQAAMPAAEGFFMCRRGKHALSMTVL